MSAVRTKLLCAAFAAALAACGDEPVAPCDECGVCDSDPTNDCAQDCAGAWGGTAVIDQCGTCDADPANDCTQDCAGAFGGAARVDQCGTCDADTTNDCVADCAGAFGGNATEDECGTCDADPSNDCVQDCGGTWGGSATVDQCDVCDTNPENDCAQDCAGTWGGAATKDHCDVCDTNVENDCVQDCAGTWGGTATVDHCEVCDTEPGNDCVQDCAGEWGGAATTDHCEVCDANAANDCVQDCAGTWGGTATADGCNVCDTNPTNDCVQDCAGAWGGTATEDQCGTCDADPSNDCTKDCQDVWGGTATLDECGRCVGGTTHRTACAIIETIAVADATVTPVSPDLNAGTGDLSVRRSSDSVYLRFATPTLPAGAVAVSAELQATAKDGYAYGGDGNVYAHFVADDSWSESSLTYANRPARSGEHLAFWWLWYGGATSDQVGRMRTPKLLEAVERESSGDHLFSVVLSSPGYNTIYYSRDTADEAKRPKLRVGYVLPSSMEIEAEADTSTDGTDLRVTAGNRKVYVRFPLAALPATAIVSSASFTMTAHSGWAWGGDGNVYVNFVSDDTWAEGTLNGGNAPAVTTPELGSWFLWYNATPHMEHPVVATPALTEAVAREAAGDGKLSLRLASPGYDTNYYSREHADAAMRPKLTVSYVVP